MAYDCKQRDQEWADAIQSSNCEAFEALFRTYSERLCAFADQHVGSPEVAEEIVQDVFLEIWQARDRWSPETNVRAYLYRSVRNRALNYLKHEEVVDKWKRQAGGEKVASLASPDENLRQKELKRAIGEAMESLPERQRLVVSLSRRHGMTYKEIAETLDISTNTVKTHMSRAFKRLRQLLAHCTVLLVALL